MAVRDGIPYAIDFCNPAPDADVNSIGEDNFDVDRRGGGQHGDPPAQAHVDGGDNLRWGEFVRRAAAARRRPTSPKGR